jgi:hypothetical protein
MQGTDTMFFQGFNMISLYLVGAASIIVVGLLILLLAGYLAMIAKRSSAVFIDLVVVLALLATMLVPPIVGLIDLVLLKR